MFDPLIVEFGIYGSGVDKVTRYTYNNGFQVHCTTSRDPSITTTDWYFGNGSKVGLVDANFREGHYPDNRTTVLQIGLNRYLSFCDGGNYSCVVKTNSSRTESRSFHLLIGSKQQHRDTCIICKGIGSKLDHVEHSNHRFSSNT